MQTKLFKSCLRHLHKCCIHVIVIKLVSLKFLLKISFDLVYEYEEISSLIEFNIQMFMVTHVNDFCLQTASASLTWTICKVLDQKRNDIRSWSVTQFS